MNEQLALEALRQGSEEALGQIMDQYAPYVYTIVFRILGRASSQADVEEVMADTFYALWNKRENVRCGKLKAYLGSIARNKARQRLRDQGVDLPMEEDVLSLPDGSLEERLEEEELAARVRGAVLAMPEPDRTIFLCHYYYGRPLAEIAQEVELSLSAVKTRLHRGRKKLREHLLEGGDPT